MMPGLDMLTHWHWGVLALVLVIAEMLMPGVFLLWVGIAAALVALLLVAWPSMPFELQLLVFALASIGSIVAWKAWRRRHPEVSEQPHLNVRGQQYVGRVFTLESAIVNGEGKVRVGDSVWKVSGGDLPAGTAVRVVDVDGIVMRVEPAVQVNTLISN